MLLLSEPWELALLVGIGAYAGKFYCKEEARQTLVRSYLPLPHLVFELLRFRNPACAAVSGWGATGALPPSLLLCPSCLLQILRFRCLVQQIFQENMQKLKDAGKNVLYPIPSLVGKAE